MTRKQALHKALDAITDEATKQKIHEILNDMPFTGWSERTIIDTIDQFIIDNGRVPNSTDFKHKGLPPHPVIKLRFGINVKEFLIQYYPHGKKCTSKIYYQKTKEEWKTIFIADYMQNKPPSAEIHNMERTTGTPSWQTISIMFGINTWLDWITYCSLERYSRVYSKPRTKTSFTILSHNDLEDEKKQYVD